jgi:hypothetical protein
MVEKVSRAVREAVKHEAGLLEPAMTSSDSTPGVGASGGSP